MHVAKNFLVDSLPAKVRMPLILGIWGPKGKPPIPYPTSILFSRNWQVFPDRVNLQENGVRSFTLPMLK